MNVVFPGSFDPAHLGHYNTLLKAEKELENIASICICQNELKPAGLFNTKERLTIAESVFFPRKIIVCKDALEVKQVLSKADYIIRGFAGIEDKEYALKLIKEYELFEVVNRLHFTNIAPEFVNVSSTKIKEAVNADISYVKANLTEFAYNMLMEKMGVSNE